jgi:hypothetical protein
VNNGNQRTSSADLFFLALFAGILVFGVGADVILRSRVGFDLFLFLGCIAFALGALWGLRILGKGAWTMVTSYENRKFNGIWGALGLTLGILFCGAILWMSVSAFIKLVATR